MGGGDSQEFTSTQQGVTAHRGTNKPISMLLYHAGWDQLYPYTADLMCLDFCRPTRPHGIQPLMEVSTPLRASAWDEALQDHPDRAFAQYVCTGIREGFRVGFQYGSPLRPATGNTPSATHHPDVVSRYIADEVARGRMLGPFPPEWHAPALHINKIGVIPKGHDSGKWRMITDLSSPRGYSTNDGIDRDLCSLVYTTVDTVADAVFRLGPGAMMGKTDVESAYRLIPVHPHDRPLQAIKWDGSVFVDPMLPFGLRSAPKIFNAVADALQWALQQAGIRQVYHYLDDFIVLGLPDTAECRDAMAQLDRVCRALGVPLAIHKTAGPTSCIVFLGIVIDSVAGELRLPPDKLRLPPDKLQRLIDLLRSWGDRRSCSGKELRSLVGHLNHAAKVVRSGRTFYRRMLDLLHGIHPHRDPNAPIRLNAGFRSDLAWWREFLIGWNGISFLPPPERLPRAEVTSDASGSWGCGAWHGNAWFQVQWDARSCDLQIAAKELIPIILACATWGEGWRGQLVTCHCDNQVVVACLRSRSSRNPVLMHMIRCLVFVEAHFCCFLQPEYINTRLNHLADDLSRDNLSSFLSKVPEAARSPVATSHLLLDLLLDPLADWISPLWRRRFSGIFRTV